MFRGIGLLAIVLILMACGTTSLIQEPTGATNQGSLVNFVQWDVPHTYLTMLIPEDWVTDYYQGTITLASHEQNLTYSPYKSFEGALIDMFVSDGPRAVGPSFDVLKLAQDFIADEPNVLQPPILVEGGGRQIVTTLYAKRDGKGKLLTFMVGFVVEAQQLTVFIAATPNDTQDVYLPILEKMLNSIRVISDW